ncbi:Rpn family recombination-promoting nuclease/putative transposase [Aerosakkonemataceae cyanobacterium BLCC-F50]|uniref:Rpn family recombination-promoting nuclease/putative transposase n=1 Tax=Floridaenema flaviceps BLCC-F50 TaxID=3153642 RepID=A0ABV4Y0T1_9CYAN
MKTDSLFYRLFQTFPSIFFELINRPPEEANNYQFSSVEIKQTAFRIDGVFLPAAGEENPIYFLEVQFQPDSEFYSRFFAEIFLYLRQNKPENDWRAVVLYPNQNTDTGDIKHYREFFTSQRVRRIYLNQLGEIAEQSIGVGTIKLVISPEENAVEQARNLINKVRSEIPDELTQTQVLQLIETILVYKLPNKSQKEIEAMFGLSELKQTRVYQDAFQEGRQEGEIATKLATVPRLLALGLTVEQIAQALELDIEEVRKAAQLESSN